MAYVEDFPDRQRDIWAMTMVSRAWYSAAISSLYHRPAISGRNFALLVRTLCPSVIAHVRKTSFSTMVKELDMSRLVHDSCKSLTARILSRLKYGLKVFIAPRASFACVNYTRGSGYWLTYSGSIAWQLYRNARTYNKQICYSSPRTSAFLGCFIRSAD